jgi:hypothetical protein
MVGVRAVGASIARLIAIISLVAVSTGIQNSPRMTRILGRVLDARTGDGVADVQVSGDGVKPALTDEEGRFELNNILSETLVLRTQKAGYLGARPASRTIPELVRPLVLLPTFANPYSQAITAPVIAPSSGVNVRVNAESLPVNLVIYKAPIVGGIVLDSRGQPLQGFLVSPLRYTYDENGQWTMQEDARSVRTDDRGEFRFSNLYPGNYNFRVSPPTLRSGEVRGQYFYSTYYPNTTDPTRAGIVTLTAGEETSLGNITLISGKGEQLRIRIMSDFGEQSTRSATVTVRRPGETVAVRSSTIAARNVAANIGEIPAGMYEVQADIETPSGRIVVFSSITVQPGDNEVIIEMPRPTTMTVDAEIEAPEPDPVPGIQVMLVPSQVGRPTILPSTNKTGRSASNPVIPAGSYRALVGGIPEGKYLASVRLSGLEILDREVTLNGKGEIRIGVILGSPSGIVEGSVLDRNGLPIFGAVVALLPDDRTQRHRYLARTTDQDGRYRFENVPGAYHLYAWGEMDGSAYLNAEYMKPYNQFGVPVQLSPRGNPVVNLTTIRGADTPQEN